MCITGGEAQRNRRIRIPNPIQKQKVGDLSPKGFHPRLLADRQSKQPTLYKFTVG
ncbi:MAG: hypothetical protein LBU34_15840 [Planctomycetaceae bacterium]|nr:hypothetical protein [Planctomycetaceae bacterium]